MAALVLVTGGVVAGRVVVAGRSGSPDASPPGRVVLTAVVEERVLVSSVVTRGDVVPEVAVPVTGPVPDGAAQPVVTGVFVELGDEVDGSQPVVEVSGRPVFVMEGSSPVYRGLGPQMSGPDVAQLQAGLVAGGCDAADSGVGVPRRIRTAGPYRIC